MRFEMYACDRAGKSQVRLSARSSSHVEVPFLALCRSVHALKGKSRGLPCPRRFAVWLTVLVVVLAASAAAAQGLRSTERRAFAALAQARAAVERGGDRTTLIRNAAQLSTTARAALNAFDEAEREREAAAAAVPHRLARRAGERGQLSQRRPVHGQPARSSRGHGPRVGRAPPAHRRRVVRHGCLYRDGRCCRRRGGARARRTPAARMGNDDQAGRPRRTLPEIGPRGRARHGYRMQGEAVGSQPRCSELTHNRARRGLPRRRMDRLRTTLALIDQRVNRARQ